ncbi:MAG: outer membrane beta-barrel protein, partial [Bacteroidaceae bacterium]
MKKILILLLLLSCIRINAQEEYKHVVFGSLEETITRKPVYDAKLTLLDADSVALSNPILIGKGNTAGHLYASVSIKINKAGKYILRCEKEGYITSYNNFEIKKLYKNEATIKLEKPFLIKRQPKSNTLKEVAIKATKVKFYFKGDTLVYNADAFELAEGSMLDALINQLPDVELKKGGEIYVRGRRVNELFLNGRDFFNNDRQIILENLPSYMVSNVKVFEREDSIMKERYGNYEKPLTMDIRLKKQYSIGWIANAEAGMGTKDKKLGRLFALRFTPQSRLSFFANMNNLNDDRKPGNNGDWNPLQQAVGEKTSCSGGLDYNVIEKRGAYRVNGNIVAKYIEDDVKSIIDRENFLSGGNTYGKSFYNSKKYNSNIETNHSFQYLKKVDMRLLEMNYLNLSPTFSYSNSRSHSESAGATLSEDANRILGSEWKEKLLNLNSSEELLTYGLNRTLLREKDNGHLLNTKLDWGFSIKIPHQDLTQLFLSGKIDYVTSKNSKYDHYTIDYYNPLNRDFRNRYDVNKTEGFSSEVDVSSRALKVRHKSSLEASLSYGFKYKRQHQTRSLYLLNKLDAWGVDSLHALGDLPSVNELLQALDNQNSFCQTQTDNVHYIYMPIKYGETNAGFKKTTVQFNFSPTIRIENNRFDYYRKTVVDTTFNRSNVFFEPTFRLSIFPVNGSWAEKWSFNIKYSLSHDAPQMLYLTGVTDNSNPLYIMKGNKDLDNASTHHFEISYSKPLSRNRNLTMASNVNVYTDKVALGYVYNQQTGVRTITPDNVNGNWNAFYSINYRSRLNKKDTWSFQNVTVVVYSNSVDLIGTSATADRSVRSRVGTTGLNDAFLMSYRPTAKMDFSLKANVHYQNASSGREDFE